MTFRIPRAARVHVPPAAAIVHVERMSPGFVKYHLDDGRALHRFTRPEPCATPHDHPWSFRTEILAGGYVEEVFAPLPGGGWSSRFLHREPGSAHDIAATHIHRIVALPAGESWTIVRTGRPERTTLFWRFGDVVQRRAWHQRRWTIHHCAAT